MEKTKQEQADEQIDKLEQALTFGEQFNFKELFRIKGEAGIFNPRSQVNKAGMVAMGGFLQPAVKKTTHKDNLICLDWYDFITTEPIDKDNVDAGFKVLKLTHVFDNIFNYVDTTDADISKLDIKQFMSLAVPNYDEFQFKDYHAKLVRKWYLLVIELLKAVTVNKEGEPIEPINNGE